jgi:hypothetical protein
MSVVKIKCEICQEIIGTADLDTLRRPMTGAMFGTHDPWHGVPPPFDPSLSWEDLRCPQGGQHRPFLTQDHVLTADGQLLEVPPFEEQDHSVKTWEETKTQLNPCPICGRVIAGKGPMGAHMRSHAKR